MIYATGGPSKNCDGISRRSFLSAGTLGLGSFGLADLLRAESINNKGSSNKSIIHIHLDGGPPQMDMIDPKPDSPVEYRGDIKSIQSQLPGVHLSELMPKVAKSAKKFAFIRSLIGADGQHNAFQCQSGFKASEISPSVMAASPIEQTTTGLFLPKSSARFCCSKYCTPMATPVEGMACIPVAED